MLKVLSTISTLPSLSIYFVTFTSLNVIIHLCALFHLSEKVQNIHVVHHIHSVQLTMSNTMVSATLVSHLSIHVCHLMVLARTILMSQMFMGYGISCLDLKSKTFFSGYEVMNQYAYKVQAADNTGLLSKATACE